MLMRNIKNSIQKREGKQIWFLRWCMVLLVCVYRYVRSCVGVRVFVCGSVLMDAWVNNSEPTVQVLQLYTVQ